MSARFTKAKPILFLIAFWLCDKWERSLESSIFKMALTVAMMILAVLFLFWLGTVFRQTRVG
jgi:hypothetical protein